MRLESSFAPAAALSISSGVNPEAVVGDEPPEPWKCLALLGGPKNHIGSAVAFARYSPVFLLAGAGASIRPSSKPAALVSKDVTG